MVSKRQDGMIEYVAHPDLIYWLGVCRDVRGGAAGEVNADDIGGGQGGEGDGDDEREEEGTEEQEGAGEEDGTGGHDQYCGG